jgi:hypothetical protein
MLQLKCVGALMNVSAKHTLVRRRGDEIDEMRAVRHFIEVHYWVRGFNKVGCRCVIPIKVRLAAGVRLTSSLHEPPRHLFVPHHSNAAHL